MSFAQRIIFLILVSTCFRRAEGNVPIEATGGGIVKIGANLILKYPTPLEWRICTWTIQLTPESKISCTFNGTKGKVEQTECKPENASSLMEYAGQDGKACAITIKTVQANAGHLWTVNIDDDANLTQSINITVVKPVLSGEIRIGSNGTITAGQADKITCSVQGGRPHAVLSLEMLGLNQSLVRVDSQTHIPNAAGEYDSVITYTVEASAQDYNRKVECKALQKDNDGLILYEFHTNSTLNVLFPPQPIGLRTFNSTQNRNVNISFDISANPRPNRIQWTIKPHAKSKETGMPSKTLESNVSQVDHGKPKVVQDVSISPVDTDAKYFASELVLVNPDGKTKYSASLTIRNVQISDEGNDYQLNVVNDIGSRAFDFQLRVSPDNSSTPGETTERLPSHDGAGSSGSFFLTVSIIVLILVLLIVAIAIVRKSKARRSETVPLNAAPRR